MGSSPALRVVAGANRSAAAALAAALVAATSFTAAPVAALAAASISAAPLGGVLCGPCLPSLWGRGCPGGASISSFSLKERSWAEFWLLGPDRVLAVPSSRPEPVAELACVTGPCRALREA